MWHESYKYDPETGCRIWIGKHANGYPVFNMFPIKPVAYANFVGDIPPGSYVRWTCKNWCVAKEHLQLITPNWKRPLSLETQAYWYKNGVGNSETLEDIIILCGVCYDEYLNQMHIQRRYEQYGKLISR